MADEAPRDENALDEPEQDRHIGAEGTEAPGEQRRSGAAHARAVDEELDAALACTFPASDPVGCLTSNAAKGCE